MQSIFESLIFTFQNCWVPLKFFAHRPHPSLHLIRNIHFVIGFWNAGFSEWKCLWANLAELENLQELRVWLNQEPVARRLQNEEVKAKDVVKIIGEGMVGKVVFDIPMPEPEAGAVGKRVYNFEDAPFGVRWHERPLECAGVERREYVEVEATQQEGVLPLGYT
jgi:hypothetical protein